MAVRRRTDNQQLARRFQGRAASAIRQTYPASLGRREVEALERKRRAEIEAGGAGPSDSWGALRVVSGGTTAST